MAVYIMACLYIVLGIAHFVIPKPFIAIIPPSFPQPEWLVALSGGMEVILGIMLFFPSTRIWAAWGLILLLIAVFPANIYMAYAPKFQNISPLVRWGRLPLQFVLIAWAYQYTQ